MAVVSPIVSAAGVWLALPWVPGPPRRRCGVMSMLHFGWMSTCNNLLVFLAWNSDNILIGRFWGADALGLYGRAYQLATLPVHQLTAATQRRCLYGIFADSGRCRSSRNVFPQGLLSARILDHPDRNQLSSVCRGDSPHCAWRQMDGGSPIFRLLAPAALVFALANPLSWLVMSTGRVGRALSISAVTTPVVVIGIVLGLKHGPQGVALGYSMAMVLVVIPITAWSKHGTSITWTDLWRATKPPLLAGLAAGAIGLIVKITLGGILAPIPYLVIGLGLVFGVYAWVLFVAMSQKSLYLDLLNHVSRERLPKIWRVALSEVS